MSGHDDLPVRAPAEKPALETQRFKFTIAYDGTAYCGWQRQPDPIPTVQRTVERAVGFIVNHPATVHGSSRTDTGVHAQGQVAQAELHTQMEPERIRRAVNSRLPDDILIEKVEAVGHDFHVSHAVRKRYRYLIWIDRDRPLFYRHYTYHHWHRVALEPMQEACKLYVGKHDFKAFRGCQDERETTTRTMFNCGIHRRGPLLIFHVEGSGFLYHMVRTMVGTILEIGRGTMPASRILEAYEAGDRKLTGPTAPAQGLCLQWIRYS